MKQKNPASFPPCSLVRGSLWPLLRSPYLGWLQMLVFTTTWSAYQAFWGISEMQIQTPSRSVGVLRQICFKKTIDSSRWATAKQDPIRSLSSASWDPLEGHKLNTQQRRSNVNWCQLALWTKLDWGRWSELPQDSVAYSTEVHHPVFFHLAYDLRKHLHESLMSPSMA